MVTFEELGFETERRSILFHRNTAMPDGSLLNYIGDPNNAVPTNTSGEFLLHYCPSGTAYMDKSVDPFIKWEKVSDAPGGLWVISGSSGEGNTTILGDLDGGAAASVYMEDQIFDGGHA